MHPEERRNFTLAYKNTYVAYLTQPRAVSMHRSFAVEWLPGAATLLAGLTQSMFNDATVRLQLYVDDPLLCVRGTGQERNTAMATVIALWSTLGVRLAFKKADRGDSVQWIGARMTVLDQRSNKARI